MFKWLKSFFETVSEVTSEPFGGQMKWQRPGSFSDMPEAAIKYIQEQADCPYCQSGYGFYEGPKGGMSVNLFCGNPGCNSRFNVCIDPPLPFGQFTGECPADFIEMRWQEIRRTVGP